MLQKRAIVTGSRGFFGRYLVQQLNKEGWDTTTMGISPGGGQHFQLSSVHAAEEIKTVVEQVQPDWVFHLAGTIKGAIEEFYSVNTCYAAHILSAAYRNKQDTGVLLIGSAAEYGPQQGNPDSMGGNAVDETCTCHPVSPYGISKYAQTLHGLSVADKQPVIVARPFNILGKGIPRHLALGNFIWQVQQLYGTDDNCIQTGSLHGVRDFVHARDCAGILIKLTEIPAAYGKIVNICSGKGVRLSSLMECLLRQLPGTYTVHENKPAHESEDIFVGTGNGLNRLGLHIPACNLEQCIHEILH